MPFAQLNISILTENGTVDFPIVLLKIILVTCEHIQNHAQGSLFCETENVVRFRGLTISRFSKNNYLLYLFTYASAIHG